MAKNDKTHKTHKTHYTTQKHNQNGTYNPVNLYQVNQKKSIFN